MPDLSIRPSQGPAEYPQLVAIWRSAVDATHDFLAEADRAEIESRLAPDYLPAVTLSVAERDGAAVGFSGERIEELGVVRGIEGAAGEIGAAAPPLGAHAGAAAEGEDLEPGVVGHGRATAGALEEVARLGQRVLLERLVLLDRLLLG